MSNPPATAAAAITGTTFPAPSHLLMRPQPGGGGGAPGSRTHSPSSLATRPGQAMAQGSMGSQTQTQTSTPIGTGPNTTAVLRLRGAHEPGTRRQIHWAEDVVDNEGLGRKSSKGMVLFLVENLEELWRPWTRAPPPPPLPGGEPNSGLRAKLTRSRSMLHLSRAQGGRRIEFRRRLQFRVGVGGVG